MAELVFFTGPMDCGKSTLALQMAHTQSLHGREGMLFTGPDRSGAAVISSRIGLSKSATGVSEHLDLWAHLVRDLTHGHTVDFIICDEAQFYRSEQIDQLARIVDELHIDVFCFGIMADFRTKLFPGSKRLVELCDRMETLQVSPLCWCGQRATHNARVVNGEMIVEGSQVVVGDTGADKDAVHYEVLCRAHHRLRAPRSVANSTLSPEALPDDPGPALTADGS